MTKAERRAALEFEKRTRERGSKFKTFYRLHVADGWESAGVWTAAHVGMLNERIDQLERKVRRLERKVSK